MNSTTHDHGDFEVYTIIRGFSILVLPLLAMATVVSNGVFLWTFYKDPLKCLRTPSAIFIAGLTSANFLTGLIAEPAFVVFYLWQSSQYTSHSEDLYHFLRFASVFFFMTMNTSYLIMLALAIIQYLLVKCPRFYQKFVSKKSALVGVIAIWIYAIFFALLPEIFDVDSYVDMGVFFLTDLVLHVTLLTVVLVVLYIAIYYEFRKLAQRHRNSDLGENTEGEGLSVGSTESEQQRRRAEKDFAYGTFILTLILIITVWPFCITLYITMCCFTWNVLIAVFITQLFLLWKFALDPFVFAWRLRKFRKSLVMAMQTTCWCPKPSLLAATYIREGAPTSPRSEVDDEDVEVTVMDNRDQVQEQAATV